MLGLLLEPCSFTYVHVFFCNGYILDTLSKYQGQIQNEDISTKRATFVGSSAWDGSCCAMEDEGLTSDDHLVAQNISFANLSSQGPKASGIQKITPPDIDVSIFTFWAFLLLLFFFFPLNIF